ncbi:MAG: hypothetical protein IKY17_05645 [Oscillospiraceae bacterium]|nr:hypothetical protein [Oscillospiraceae bacterium]
MVVIFFFFKYDTNERKITAGQCNLDRFGVKRNLEKNADAYVACSTPARRPAVSVVTGWSIK